VKRSGFTLVELMLAIVILAVVMALIYGVLASTVQAQRRVEEITLGSEIGPAILTQIRLDLEAAFLPKGEGFIGYDRKSSGGDRDRVDFISAVMAYGPGRDGEDPKFHGVNEVGYQVQDSRTDPNVGILYRREDYFIDAEPLKGGRLTEMYDRVRHFTLLLWDGEQWRGDWNSKKETDKRPQAVKIELKILVVDRDEQAAEQSYVTTVTFPR
jgi:prepilin-type N-terminal cleavage/methylation domain-containing protein